MDAGFAEIKKLEALLDFFSDDSEISAINKAAGYKAVKVSVETLDIIKKALMVSDDTNGAFDPAIGPLTKLWGFSGKGAAGIPQDGKIKNILPLINYKKIMINSSLSEVSLQKKGMEMDLGAIAKGYAADKVIEAIKAAGIQAALVSIAGDIKGFGIKPDGKPWRVGIQDPRADGIFAAIDLQDKAVSTSGDYQRYFIKDGRRYHHIMDPKTGYPASVAISVSVIADNGYAADSFSTGVFVLGPEKGIKLLESMGLSGIIVDAAKKIHLTKDLDGKITIEKPLFPPCKKIHQARKSCQNHL
ncbi:MAG: FAD:protein FMN transferase [Nitrospirae bacterium]|nr:FAD:protein FMN transferase [Nitrospirota bacterium]